PTHPRDRPARLLRTWIRGPFPEPRPDGHHPPSGAQRPPTRRQPRGLAGTCPPGPARLARYHRGRILRTDPGILGPPIRLTVVRPALSGAHHLRGRGRRTHRRYRSGRRDGAYHRGPRVPAPPGRTG